MKQFVIIYPKFYVNNTDYYNPIKSSQVLLVENFKPGALMENFMYTDKLEVDIINDI